MRAISDYLQLTASGVDITNNSYGFRSVCVDPDPARRAMAERLGADLVVDPTVPGYRELVQDFCHQL